MVRGSGDRHKRIILYRVVLGDLVKSVFFTPPLGHSLLEILTKYVYM